MENKLQSWSVQLQTKFDGSWLVRGFQRFISGRKESGELKRMGRNQGSSGEGKSPSTGYPVVPGPLPPPPSTGPGVRAPALLVAALQLGLERPRGVLQALLQRGARLAVRDLRQVRLRGPHHLACAALDDAKAADCDSFRTGFTLPAARFAAFQ